MFADQFKRHRDDEIIKFFVNDKEAKSYKLIHEVLGWIIKENPNFRYNTKSWEKMFEGRLILILVFIWRKEEIKRL